MDRLILRIADRTNKQLNHGYAAFSAFHYEEGYKFSAIDLGTQGVKMELNQDHDVGAAIILPPDKVHQCGRWLLQTIGQDSFGLPKDLIEILARLLSHEKAAKILHRGDKKKIKDALKVLRQERLQARAEGKTLRLISASAI
jgi:hypothetical protein